MTPCEPSWAFGIAMPLAGRSARFSLRFRLDKRDICSCPRHLTGSANAAGSSGQALVFRHLPDSTALGRAGLIRPIREALFGKALQSLCRLHFPDPRLLHELFSRHATRVVCVLHGDLLGFADFFEGGGACRADGLSVTRLCSWTLEAHRG